MVEGNEVVMTVSKGQTVLVGKYSGTEGQDRRGRTDDSQAGRHPCDSRVSILRERQWQSRSVYGEEARKAIERGVNQLADTAEDNPRPQGQERGPGQEVRAPLITNDGVTIAKEIELEDAFENMGAQLIREVSTKTNDVAGDGTTTATLLAQSMIREGLKNPGRRRQPDGHAPRHPEGHGGRRRRDPREQPAGLRQPGYRPCRHHLPSGDELIGRLIAEAMEKVSQNGVITVEECKTAETYRGRRGHAVRPRLHHPLHGHDTRRWKPS